MLTKKRVDLSFITCFGWSGGDLQGPHVEEVVFYKVLASRGFGRLLEIGA
jgi:hypothetical protein